MSTYQHPQELVNEFYGLIRTNQAEAALALAQANHDVPMDELNPLTLNLWFYNCMCLAGRFGYPDEAIAYLQEAIDRGFWFSPTVLTADDDIECLVGDPRFEALREISTARYEKFVSDSPPSLDVYPPATKTDNLPLLMAVHGNISSGALSYQNWKVATDCGRLLAMPTSSYLFIENGYMWMDMEKGVEELKAHYESLKSEYDLAFDQTIMGGYITGGNLAIWLTLNQVFPIKGFIVVGPFIRDQDEWINRLDGLKGSDVRGYILVGKQDAGSIESATTFAEAMQERGIPCELDVRDGLNHDELPDDFEETLKRAIAFVSR